MDRVRFGRALGWGARQAVKTLATAVDAATAESPSRKSTGTSQSQRPAASPRTAANPGVSAKQGTAPKVGRAAKKTSAQAGEVRRGLGRGSRRLGQEVWRPLVRLSGVLWLEVTGVFFGIFALFALGATWRLRGAWHANAADRRSLVGAVAMLAVFGYFCASSFVRARRRERRR
jgi:hypothetical protein